MKIDRILVRPMLTEKATNLANSQVYLFEVDKKANKHNVKQALEKLYKVKVKQVRITLRKGKVKRVGKRMVNKKMPNRKIAFIQLSEGKLDVIPQA